MQAFKLLRFRAAILVGILLLAGCENSDPQSLITEKQNNNASIHLSFWTPFSGGDGVFMADLVKRFNQENPDHIYVDLKNNRSDDYYTKLSTAIVTEEPPDVAIIHASKYAQFVSAGFITDIDDYASKADVNWSDFNPTILKGTIYKGKHYSIPLDTHLEVMYYNKKWLRQAGLLDDDGKPMLQPGADSLIAFLQRIKEKVPSDIAPLALPNVRIDSFWVWWSFYNQLANGGGRMYSEDGKSAAIDNPAALKSLEYVNALYTSKLIPGNISDSMKLFTDGQAAVLFLGVWATGAFENTPGLDFGVTNIPQIYDQPGTWGDSHTFAFPKQDRLNPDHFVASIKFANWVAEHGAGWAKAGHLPAVTKVIDSDEFKAMKYRSDYASSANHVKFFPNNPAQGKITDLMIKEIVKEFEKMMFGKQTPKEVLQNLQIIINESLKE